MIISMSKITCLMTSGIFMSALAACVMKQAPNTDTRIIGSQVFGTALAG